MSHTVLDCFRGAHKYQEIECSIDSDGLKHYTLKCDICKNIRHGVEYPPPKIKYADVMTRKFPILDRAKERASFDLNPLEDL